MAGARAGSGSAGVAGEQWVRYLAGVMSLCSLVALAAIASAAGAPGLSTDRARAESLVEAAARHAGTPAAADELLSAAELYDHRLHELERAARLYRRVAAGDPESRAGERAAARLERIEPLLEPPREAGREWAAIRLEHDTRTDRDSDARARQLLADFPGWPGAGNVELWLGERALGAGRVAEARRHLRAAAASTASTGIQRDALGSLVQLGLLAGGQLGEAEDALARLRAHGPLTLHEETLAARVRVERERLNLVWLALALLLMSLVVLAVALVGGTGSGTRLAKELARMPGEVIFVAPVFAILIALALIRAREYLVPLAWVSLAGIAFTWLAMVALRVRRRALASTVAIGLAAALGVASSVYIAMHQTGMLDSIADTMREGAGH